MKPTDGESTGERDAPLVECSGVAKSFSGRGLRGLRGREVRVLEGVDLCLRRGEVVAVTGRSGAGKSTLLRVLGALERPSSGSVEFEGRRLEAMSGAELASLRRRKVGIVFQSFNLLPSWTAAENVEAALLHCGIPRAHRREMAEALLREVGLGDRLDHLPGELSVGERQRVAVARALANSPALILADEPAAGVDAETARGIMELLAARAADGGRTLVIATHGPVPGLLAARELRLEGGRLVPG